MALQQGLPKDKAKQKNQKSDHPKAFVKANQSKAFLEAIQRLSNNPATTTDNVCSQGQPECCATKYPLGQDGASGCRACGSVAMRTMPKKRQLRTLLNKFMDIFVAQDKDQPNPAWH